jgi:hypothetical protein
MTTSLCAQCGSTLPEGAVVCIHCGSAVAQPPPAATEAALAAPFTPAPQTPTEPAYIPPDYTPDSSAPAYIEDNYLNGIGGWLILPVIGLALAPFFYIHGIYADFHVLYGSRFQTSLDTRPGLVALIYFELINNSVFIAASIGLNLLLYKKRRIFPTYMCIYLLAQFLFVLADHLMALRFNPDSSWAMAQRAFFTCVVWVSYFVRSKRVEATFTR